MSNAHPIAIPESSITVDSIRYHLISRIESKNSNVDFHPNDLEKIKTNDYFINRYIRVFDDRNQENYEKRVKIIVNAIMKGLKWRNEFGINDIKQSDVPREIFESGLINEGKLPNGDTLLVIIGRKYQICSEWNSVFISAILWYYERLEGEMKCGQKVRILLDCSGCGWKQADFQLLYEAAPIFLKYYLGIISVSYFYEIPGFMKYLFPIFLSVFPNKFRKRAIIIGKDDVSCHLGGDNVPDILGGPLITTCPKLPDRMSDIEAVGKSRGIKAVNVLKFRQFISETALMD